MQYCNPDMLHMHTSALKSYAGRKLFAQNYDCTVLAQRGRFAELIAPRSPPLPANRGGKRETEACSTCVGFPATSVRFPVEHRSPLEKQIA